MKISLTLSLLLVLLGIVSCQSATPTLDPISVQNTTVAIGNTAISMAWTSVSKTQIASTVFPTEVRPTRVPPPTQKPSVDDIVLGRWVNENISICQNIKIIKSGDIYKMKTTCGDGSSETVILTVKNVDGKKRLYEDVNNYFGDYMVIESGNYLAFYDNQGFIYKLPPK